MASQIGAQLYTLRDYLKTPSDIAKTCKRLSEMGFEAVQVSAVGEIETKELRKILDDNGLVCAATHVSLDMMKDTEAVLDYHRTLGCELTAIGGFGWGDDRSEQHWRNFAVDYSRIAQTLAGQGLRIGYHNHSHELAPIGEPAMGVKTPLQLLIDETDPSVWFEIDTYWIAHGGADPAAWIEKVSGRLPAVHVKDMTITPEREQKMCEVGSGNLNWPAILKACQAAGTQWYLIERDQGDLDPFDSLKISLENLKTMGLR